MSNKCQLWSLSHIHNVNFGKGLNYCKTLIFRVTLFSRAHDFGFIHETLFSRLFISCTTILTWEILAWTLFSRVTALANLRENKVLANKKCLTVLHVLQCARDKRNVLPIFYKGILKFTSCFCLCVLQTWPLLLTDLLFLSLCPPNLTSSLNSPLVFVFVSSKPDLFS